MFLRNVGYLPTSPHGLTTKNNTDMESHKMEGSPLIETADIIIKLHSRETYVSGICRTCFTITAQLPIWWT
jgi:hypothetical protein